MTNLRDRDGKIVSTRVLAIISSSCIFLPCTREICRFFPGNGDPCRFENFFPFRKKEKFSNGTILKMNKIGFRIYLKGWIIYIFDYDISRQGWQMGFLCYLSSLFNEIRSTSLNAFCCIVPSPPPPPFPPFFIQCNAIEMTPENFCCPTSSR